MRPEDVPIPMKLYGWHKQPRTYPVTGPRFAVARKRMEAAGMTLLRDDEELAFELRLRGYDKPTFDMYYIDEIQDRFGVQAAEEVVAHLMLNAAGVIFVLR
jgi:hypothetical protein